MLGSPEPPLPMLRQKTCRVRSPITSMSASPVFMSGPVTNVPPSESTSSAYRSNTRRRSSPVGTDGTASTALPPPHGSPSTASLRVIPAASRRPSSSASAGSPYVSSASRPSRGRGWVEWMQTSIQSAGRRVIAGDGVLAVPAPQQLLEHDSTLLAGERLPKPLEPGVERLVRDGEGEPCTADARAPRTLRPARARPAPPAAGARRTTRPGAGARRRTFLRNGARARGGPRRRGRDAPRTAPSARPPSPAGRSALRSRPAAARRRSRRARAPAATSPARRAPRSRARIRAASPPCRSSSRARRARPRPRARRARRESSAARRPSKTRSPYAKSCRTVPSVQSARATASAKTPSGAAAPVGFDG